MADFNATVPTDPTTVFGERRYPKVPGVLRDPQGSASVTYYYRETGGARGSTTSVGAIPVGAVVLRAVTS